MQSFKVGDHVENKPVATVDGIVYRVSGELISFCDEHGINYKMNADGLRPRFEDFTWSEKHDVLRINAPKFGRLRLYK